MRPLRSFSHDTDISTPSIIERSPFFVSVTITAQYIIFREHIRYKFVCFENIPKIEEKIDEILNTDEMIIYEI
jgi:hypothetical protein